MKLSSVNHTESERRLHRVLYFINYERMLFLHLTLIAAASVLSLSFGIRGLYPAADNQVEGLIKAAQQASEQGGLMAFYGMSALGFLTSFALIITCYLTIIRVWRIPLKLLSAAWWLITVAYPFAAWTLWHGYHEATSPWFKGLHLLNNVILFWLAMDLAIGLWRVSTSPEKHSFNALLDLRISRGLMTKVNRFLELPRSPFLSWRSFAAYLLAILGAVLLLRCVSCIVSLDHFTLKYSQLHQISGAATAEDIRRQSDNFASAILWNLAFAGAGLWVINKAQGYCRRKNSHSVERALSASNGRYILFLRPFDVDDFKLSNHFLPLISRFSCFRPFSIFLEAELFDVSDGYLPLIAVGNPKRRDQRDGTRAYRDFVTDSEWEAYVRGRMEKAQNIVIVLRKSKHVLWEFEKVLETSQTQRTLFMFDPLARATDEWQEIFDSVKPEFVKAGLFAPDFKFDGQPLAFYFSGGNIIQIVNTNWSATSYRTAFAQYLAESLAPPTLT